MDGLEQKVAIFENALRNAEARQRRKEYTDKELARLQTFANVYTGLAIAYSILRHHGLADDRCGNWQNIAFGTTSFGLWALSTSLIGYVRKIWAKKDSKYFETFDEVLEETPDEVLIEVEKRPLATKSRFLRTYLPSHSKNQSPL